MSALRLLRARTSDMLPHMVERHSTVEPAGKGSAMAAHKPFLIVGS